MSETEQKAPSETAKPRVRTSVQTEAFDEAFAKAQAKFEAAVKSNTNPAFRSKYADVSSIIDATLEHLNSEGIGVKQHPGFSYLPSGDGVEAFMVVTTRLTFKGQWEESEIAIPAVQRDKFDAQSCGSALTYACRYALQGIFVVRREDDDANSAVGRGSTEAAKAVADKKIADLKAKASEIAPSAQETDTRRIVWVKVLLNSDIAVNGFLADNVMADFLRDIDAKRKPSKTGGYYYQFEPRYLADFKIVCEKQEIEIG